MKPTVSETQLQEYWRQVNSLLASHDFVRRQYAFDDTPVFGIVEVSTFVSPSGVVMISVYRVMEISDDPCGTVSERVDEFNVTLYGERVKNNRPLLNSLTDLQREFLD